MTVPQSSATVTVAVSPDSRIYSFAAEPPQGTRLRCMAFTSRRTARLTVPGSGLLRCRGRADVFRWPHCTRRERSASTGDFHRRPQAADLRSGRVQLAGSARMTATCTSHHALGGRMSAVERNPGDDSAASVDKLALSTPPQERGSRALVQNFWECAQEPLIP